MQVGNSIIHSDGTKKTYSEECFRKSGEALKDVVPVLTCKDPNRKISIKGSCYKETEDRNPKKKKSDE